MQRTRAAEVGEGAHRGNVERAGEGLADGDGTAESAVIVLGGIEAFLGAEAGRDVGDDGARMKAAFFECEQPGEWLQRGAGGAWDEGAIDLAAVGVAPVAGGDEGEDLAGFVVEDDDRGVLKVGSGELVEFLADDGFEVLLEGGIE